MQALFPAWFMISDIFVKRFDKNISTPDKKFQIVFIFQLMINKSEVIDFVKLFACFDRAKNAGSIATCSSHGYGLEKEKGCFPVPC